MKHIYLKTLGLLMGALLTACHTDEVPISDESNSLRLLSVSLGEEEVSKAAVSSINEVKIYTTSKSHVALSANALSTYRYSGSTWISDAAPELTAEGNFIYAYYPVTKEGGPTPITVTNDAGGNHTIPVSVRSEDTFDGKQDDYLYASGSPISADLTSKAISLEMNHALSNVIFQITKSSAATEQLTLTKIEVRSRTNRLQSGDGGVMNLKTGQINGLISGSSLVLTGSTVLSSSTATDISALMAPMSGQEQVLSFSLTVEVDGETRTFETSSVSSTQQWEAGKKYVYQIKVDKTKGTFEGVKVYDWKTGADQNTQVGI